MEVLLACIVIVIGAFVQTAIGFGLAVIAAPLLFFIDPLYVPAPITMCALVLSVFNVYSYRGHVSFRGLGNAIIGRIPGSLSGGAVGAVDWTERARRGGGKPNVFALAAYTGADDVRGLHVGLHGH